MECKKSSARIRVIIPVSRW